MSNKNTNIKVTNDKTKKIKVIKVNPAKITSLRIINKEFIFCINVVENKFLIFVKILDINQLRLYKKKENSTLSFNILLNRLNSNIIFNGEQYLKRLWGNKKTTTRGIRTNGK